MDKYFATVARGLETLAAQELENLGAHSVEPGFCRVAFRGDRTLLYRVNLWARLPFRILMKLDEFRCQDAQELAQSIKLKSSQRTPVFNGTLPCQLMKYELY